MSQAALHPSATVTRLAAIGREIIGILAGGLLGAIAWTVVLSRAFDRGWSDQNFTEALGELRGAELTDIPRLGLWTGLAVGIALAILVLPASYRLVPGRWFVKAIPLAIVAFLIWALWFSPRLGDETTFPGGFFGADAGYQTLLSYLAAALAYGLVGGRVYSVATSRDFWMPKANDLRAQGADVMTELGLGDTPAGAKMDGAASLELPEEGLQKPGKPSGR